MPGRLNMEDQSITAGSQGFKKDRSHASETTDSYAVGAANPPRTNGVVSNGANGILPNGTQQNDSRNGAEHRTESGPPPPLDQSWREGPENKSLGKLMIRTAEKCWADLDNVLKNMAAQPVAQQSAGPNGVTPEYDSDAVSLAKKRQLMDFAQAQRDRFIKALVISDWAKDADAFAGIIDVNAHLGRINACHTGATSAVGEMKLAMNQAKMPNPNIEGALELLSTGKSYGLPDFGYITPPKMSAKALLRTLKDMNVMLATRLTLHEDLPEHFNEYTIADGRATFTVPGEFAVDLAVADEDTTSPFFFIELRFLFTPAPSQLSEQIQNICEAEVNKAIAAKGLGGCYDVLHNFILTHKLNVLHSQVAEVVRGKWFESIRVERIRRSLVLSYWTKRPGRKSWIEFSIGSGRTAYHRQARSNTNHRYTMVPA
jgi:mediator of RNA polymerase II transcription subunit 14